MRRSRTLPETRTLFAANHADVEVTAEDDVVAGVAYRGNSAITIVHNIASFLTLSDAASLGAESFAQHMAGWGDDSNSTPADSWAVGVELYGEEEGDIMTSNSLSIVTPLTPALVALSPGASPPDDEEENDMSRVSRNGYQVDDPDDNLARRKDSVSLSTDEDSWVLQEKIQKRRRKWAQEKIITAVFSHPHSLRSFCWEAYEAAQAIHAQKERQRLAQEQQLQQWQQDHQENLELSQMHAPETLVEPPIEALVHRHRRPSRKARQRHVLHQIMEAVLSNVPVSILLDVLEKMGVFTLDTTVATFRLTGSSLHAIVSLVGQVTYSVWDAITNFNPFTLLEAIISLQFNAMGRTSEALASGIQSVATGVGSASSMALHRFGPANLSTGRSGSSSSLVGHARDRHRRGGSSGGTRLNKKLLKKLSSINDAARVVSYLEIEDDTGGLTKHAISRTRRMMHYSVSLRPFVATVSVTPSNTAAPTPQLHNRNYVVASVDLQDGTQAPPVPFSAHARVGSGLTTASDGSVSLMSSRSGSPEKEDDSPFMCTPQSFPPTPHSRQHVMAQKTRFSDDVVFLARDRLRVHDGLQSDNEKTREMARALREGHCLAVFDGKDAGNGVELTCGQHIATKVGTMYYSSTRSMVPILRNCYVYFEMSVLPPLKVPDPSVAAGSGSAALALQAAAASLSIGLSTEEMPPNTLVGAWLGSVGLCSTGQLLIAGQWCSPADASLSAFGANCTVGCLVCLDDDRAFELWDGVMVTASVTFSVNGICLPPPVATLPVAGAFPGSGSQLSSSAGSRAGAKYPSADHSRASDNDNSTLTLLVPASEDLYPTLTLQSSATAVMCRFSAEDILASSRSMVGASPGVIVYAVDGSVIWKEDEPLSSPSHSSGSSGDDESDVHEHDDLDEEESESFDEESPSTE